MSKTQSITREEVDEAWKAVRRAGGGGGVDGKTIEQVEKNLDDELYKIWNRMSAGSYQAQPVKVVMIPKAKGGMRALGIPTVTDRVAQTVVKNKLVKIVDSKFHPDSYGYREGKSAIDAVLQARQRSMRTEWAIEVDIKSFFDEVDHELMMEILKQHTEDKSILLYCERFLKADEETEGGERVKRDKGTPQGGVISPVLANLFLHEAFDKWMQEKFAELKFERYADDIIVHCRSEKEAYYMRNRIGGRLEQYKLQLHSEKTKVVYTGVKNDHDKRGHKLSRKFTFLGYDFKPRLYKGRLVYSPAMGSGAMARINEVVKQWRLGSKTCQSIAEIAGQINRQVRGWINYYGHCRRSELYKLADLLDKRIVKWLGKKHKIRLHGKAWDVLKAMKKKHSTLFVHWYMIERKQYVFPFWSKVLGPSTRGAV